MKPITQSVSGASLELADMFHEDHQNAKIYGIIYGILFNVRVPDDPTEDQRHALDWKFVLVPNK